MIAKTKLNMPQISDKSRALPASAIRKLTPFADAAKADGVKVYHLNVGAPDIDSPQSALDAVRGIKEKHLSYSNSAGTLELRKALIEKYYRKIGIDVGIADIIVNVAGSEAIDVAIQVCCDPGDEIIVTEPFYTNYFTMTERAGVVMKAVHTDIHEGFKVPPAETMEQLVTPGKTKAVLISNPGNPTGALYTREDMLALGAFCLRHDLFLISDEVYREFCYTDEPHFSAMNIPGMEQNVILVDSLSKRYNLCGSRIGCTLSRNKDVIAAVTKFAQARLCPPVLGQLAALGALEAPESYFKAVREEYIRRRDCAIEALNNMEGVYSPTPMGAFYTLAELPVDDAETFSKWMLTDFRLNGETVMVTPAASFYRNREYGRHQVRIAYVLEVPELKKAFHVLAEGLKAYNSKN